MIDSYIWVIDGPGGSVTGLATPGEAVNCMLKVTPFLAHENVACLARLKMFQPPPPFQSLYVSCCSSYSISGLENVSNVVVMVMALFRPSSLNSHASPA
jgi:hypothetical protein